MWYQQVMNVMSLWCSLTDIIQWALKWYFISFSARWLSAAASLTVVKVTGWNRADSKSNKIQLRKRLQMRKKGGQIVWRWRAEIRQIKRPCDHRRILKWSKATVVKMSSDCCWCRAKWQHTAVTGKNETVKCLILQSKLIKAPVVGVKHFWLWQLTLNKDTKNNK